MRALAHHSFPLENDDTQRFDVACELWARHLLSGEKAPIASCPDHTLRGGRAWAALRKFYLQHRVHESNQLRARMDASQQLLIDVEHSLRKSSSSNQQVSQAAEQAVQELMSAAQSDSIDEVRKAIENTAGHLRDQLEAQRRCFDQEAQTLRKRVESLSHIVEPQSNRDLVDPLTQLQTRSSFQATLRRYIELSRVSYKPLNLVLVDVDLFRDINDRHGHPCGDRVLVKVADAMIRSFPRKHDFIARYDGDEFGAILFDTTDSETVRATQRLLTTVIDFEFKEVGHQVTCSAGAAALQSTDTSDKLIERARHALNYAKQQGRNRLWQYAAIPSLMHH